MASARRRPAAGTRARHEQAELFPEPVHVERLEAPRTGRRTSTQGIYRVTLGYDRDTHVVYHDRHGVYCEVHGRDCRAAATVERWERSDEASRGD